MLFDSQIRMSNNEDRTQNGSNPLVIIVLALGVLFSLVYVGSQSSQGNMMSPTNLFASLMGK